MHLIIGGARSGKSNYAQTAAQHMQTDVTYIATATRIDDAMSSRIAHHMATRPSHWRIIEEPLNLKECLLNLKAYQGVVLVDCLTLWLNNQLYHHPDTNIPALVEETLLAAKQCSNLIIVTNEVGLGIIPMGEISQRFVDESGRMNQAFAQAATKVTFMVAGIAQRIKG